ncbi:MAG: endolytic transglycosylase MltG [Armatimonadota bacterium]
MARSKRKSQSARPTRNGFILVLALGAAVSVFSVAWYRPALRPVDPTASKTQLVKIDKGSSGWATICLLKREGIIRSELAAWLYAIGFGQLRRFKAGYYDLSPALSTCEILKTIADGKVAQRRVVVTPGLRLTQIADRVAASGLTSREDFLAAAIATNYVSEIDMPLPEGRTLEGYLFPATYTFAFGTPAREIVRRMVQAFYDSFYKPYAQEIVHRGSSLHELVTMASLVEGEAARDSERPIIAGVLYNRLRKGMRLQCDATVQYALGRHKPRLFFRDLKVESPYNTYLHDGLPPGPIGSPGLASLLAALRPAKHDYLFYVAKGGGYHQFTRTYAEHQQAIARIRSEKRRPL